MDYQDSPETARLTKAYIQTLYNDFGFATSTGALALCAGPPGSSVRRAFMAMLASMDADFTSFKSRETYREAMMKD